MGCANCKSEHVWKHTNDKERKDKQIRRKYVELKYEFFGALGEKIDWEMKKLYVYGQTGVRSKKWWEALRGEKNDKKINKK